MDAKSFQQDGPGIAGKLVGLLRFLRSISTLGITMLIQLDYIGIIYSNICSSAMLLTIPAMDHTIPLHVD